MQTHEKTYKEDDVSRLSLIDKAFLLKGTAPFRTLTLDILLPIAEKLVLALFDKDDEIFHWDDEAHRMYFIVEGKVELSDPQGTKLMLNTRASFFGDEAVFSGLRRSYRAVSKSDAELLTLSQTNLLTIISEYPTVALGFLALYAEEMPERALKVKR